MGLQPILTLALVPTKLTHKGGHLLGTSGLTASGDKRGDRLKIRDIVSRIHHLLGNQTNSKIIR